MIFMVRYTGIIDGRKRPENFPPEIWVDIFYNVQNEAELKKKVNDQGTVFLAQQAMIVQRDMMFLEDPTKIQFDTRMIVPMHMITSIHTTTHRVLGEMPEITPEGKAQLPDGTKVTIQ